MLEKDRARVLRHGNDGFTQQFATDRSPGKEDSAEPLSIQHFPQRHVYYSGATESPDKKTGRDFRREALDHLARCCQPGKTEALHEEIADLIPQPRRKTESKMQSEGICREAVDSSMKFMQGVILDFETTGHSPEQDSILQIAAVAVDLRTGCQLDHFDTHLHQEWTTVPAYVRKLTGIRREDLIPAPSPEQALCQLASFTPDAQWVIAHNARHCEIPFLKLACLQQGIAVRQVHACDTVDLSVRLWGREVRHDLNSVLKRLGIPTQGFRRHDARDDASLLTEALRRMLGLINVADPSLGMQCFDGFLPI